MSFVKKISDGEITVKLSDWERIQKRLALLDALEDAGVDNWEWYGDAVSSLEDED